MAKKDKGKKKEKKKIVRKTNIILKKKKKKWVSILAPKEYRSMEIGESYVADVQSLKGKRIIMSLSNLGRGKNFAIKVIFEVKEIVEGNGVCESIGYYLLNSYSRRVVKKGRTKIHKVFKMKTKDNVNVIMKISMSTVNKVPGGVSTTLRKGMDNYVTEEIKKVSFNALLDNVIGYGFQKKMKESLKKVYPVASLEVVSFRKA
jgi:small subunit ribosomal protein S3Ae